MENSILWQAFRTACRHLLSEQDRDAYSLTRGCFDRRYWGWKLVDYPEATFQRNVYPLAWWLRHDHSISSGLGTVLSGGIINGLIYAARIQHADGSFDQAFPQEHSFGATAFLLHPLLEAYRLVHSRCSPSEERSITSCLRRAAGFLSSREETHGFISNHIAGAVLSLLSAADLFQEPRYEQRAGNLLEKILQRQSPEGWFMEYDGADPGYQTLCLYYLAQVHRLRPAGKLHAALGRAVDFLAWFVHPDGTFGGEYGSRRTAVFYPGGLVLLGREFPMAGSMVRFMLAAAQEGRTVSLADVDMGNMAPLLSNYALVLEGKNPGARSLPALPCEVKGSRHDFPQAGLYIRSGRSYYAVLGVSNGGVLKVFDTRKRIPLWNDSGYVGQAGGSLVTTQMTTGERVCQAKEEQIYLEAPFYVMPRSQPTPFQFIILRLLNLTVMRSIFLGNLVKRFLVMLLIRGGRRIPFTLARTVRFEEDQVVVGDELRGMNRLKLNWLEYGRPFVSIHMASARYYENAAQAACSAKVRKVPIEKLSAAGSYRQQVRITVK